MEIQKVIERANQLITETRYTKSRTGCGRKEFFRI